MSKKIKALVQKYEKDMQFENRFDELKNKLDLIPDSEPSHDVYVIKRKVMPAYVMIIVLLMLVTGIIGLQFGLNTNYVTGPEQVDKIEEKLSTLVDIFERESVATLVLDDDAKVNIYIGVLHNEKVIVVYGQSNVRTNQITIDYLGTSYVLRYGDNYSIIELVDEANINLSVEVINSNVTLSQADFLFDFTLNYNYLGF